MIFVWLSPFSFVPVPWPDDSAFYFVAKSLFHWPPRYVMLAQAPFEPSYGIFNFNSMPLFPTLIGLGRWIGIDGSFGIKFWSLLGWALSGFFLLNTLRKKGLPDYGLILIALAFSADPILRWGAVIVRPESLIGLCGMLLVLGLTFGFPKRWRPRIIWDPISVLFAIAAYLHFNAIHLVLPVLLTFISAPRRLVAIGLKTLLYLSPWIVIALSKWDIFTLQMHLQWSRLAVRNDWLDSPTKALAALFESMGSPEPWSPLAQWASALIWMLIILALIKGLIFPSLEWLHRQVVQKAEQSSYSEISLVPAAAWILSACVLWDAKPEVWFTYYIHLSVWCFAGVFAVKTYRERRVFVPLGILITAIVCLFFTVNLTQLFGLSQGTSWRWSTYREFVDCVDQAVTQIESRIASPKPFRVWCPTFPDITVELSRRHPSWILTRTNDFWDRQDLAIEHGKQVEAVVVTETINWEERNISSPQSDHPEIQSTWLTWKDYFLNRLWVDMTWKPKRYLCQKGRWQGFIFSDR